MRTINTWTVIAVSLALSSTTRATKVSDPTGDLLPSAVWPAFDIIEAELTVTATTVEVVLTFDPAEGTPEDLEIWLGGYVDFDLDRNVGTGHSSAIDQYAAPPSCPMGVDYAVTLTLDWDLFVVVAQLDRYDGGGVWTPKGVYPVVIVDNTASFVLDRAASPATDGLPVTGAFDYAYLAGNGMGGPTDRVPNDSMPLRFAHTGDTDLDGDVDLTDFGVLQSCFNGPNRPPLHAGCEIVDFDQDTDVDLTDFSVFQQCFNGPNRPPAPGCRD